MNERLTRYRVPECRQTADHANPNGVAVYLASDVESVLAEKDRQIAELRRLFQAVRQSTLALRQGLDLLETSTHNNAHA